jgi:hypothetical protein
MILSFCWGNTVLIYVSKSVSIIYLQECLKDNRDSGIYTKKERFACHCWGHGKGTSMKFGVLNVPRFSKH